MLGDDIGQTPVHDATLAQLLSNRVEFSILAEAINAGTKAVIAHYPEAP
jgi:hypothetical protein